MRLSKGQFHIRHRLLATETICLRVLSLHDVSNFSPERHIVIDVLNLLASCFAHGHKFLLTLYAQETPVKQVRGNASSATASKWVKNPCPFIYGIK